MRELISLKSAMLELIRGELKNQSQPSKLFVVTGINSDKTINIRDMTSKQSFDSVQFVAPGLGNAKGQNILPAISDIVYVDFIGGDSGSPIILGSLYDTFSQSPDNKMPIVKDEYFVSAKTNGSYIYIKASGDVEIKTGAGTFILGNDGSFTMPNYKFPSADGSNGQLLKTNGTGVLSWQNDNV